MELTFSINNQRIKYTGKQYIVALSKNMLTARFIFSGNDWKNVGKTALFKKDGQLYAVLLDSEGRCNVPYECLQTSGTMEVSAFGGNLVTVDSVQVEINSTIYDEASQPGSPTPSVYDQILSELQTIRVYYVQTESELSAIQQQITEALAAISIGVSQAEGYANDAHGYADNAYEQAQRSKVWAVGPNDPATDGSDTNNSKYYATQSAASAAEAADTLDNVVTAINEAVETNVPNIIYDFTDGHLYWEGGRFSFAVDPSTMHLMWEVS